MQTNFVINHSKSCKETRCHFFRNCSFHYGTFWLHPLDCWWQQANTILVIQRLLPAIQLAQYTSTASTTCGQTHRRLALHRFIEHVTWHGPLGSVQLCSVPH